MQKKQITLQKYGSHAFDVKSKELKISDFDLDTVFNRGESPERQFEADPQKISGVLSKMHESQLPANPSRLTISLQEVNQSPHETSVDVEEDPYADNHVLI